MKKKKRVLENPKKHFTTSRDNHTDERRKKQEKTVHLTALHTMYMHTHRKEDDGKHCENMLRRGNEPLRIGVASKVPEIADQAA